MGKIKINSNNLGLSLSSLKRFYSHANLDLIV